MAEPVTLEQVKARLGVRSNHRDQEITGLIPAARFLVEYYSQKVLSRRQVRQYFPAFPCVKPIVLAAWPVVSLTSIQYLDVDGVGQEIEGARLLAHPPFARIYSPVGSAWPVPGDPAGIVVDVLAGYDEGAEPDSDDGIPSLLLQAMYLLIGHWFENHEAVAVGNIATEVPLGVRDICWNFRDDPGIS